MTYEEQVRHYADIRRRLYNPPTRVPDSIPAPVCRDVKIAQEEPEKKPERREKDGRKWRNRQRKKKNRTITEKEIRRQIYARLDEQYRKRHDLLVPNPDSLKWIGIVNRVTLETGVTLADMKSKCSVQRIARAVAQAMYLMVEEIGASHPWIAKRLERDPSTVSTAVRRYRERNGL